VAAVDDCALEVEVEESVGTVVPVLLFPVLVVEANSVLDDVVVIVDVTEFRDDDDDLLVGSVLVDSALVEVVVALLLESVAVDDREKVSAATFNCDVNVIPNGLSTPAPPGVGTS
jgi:hypothetical protein